FFVFCGVTVVIKQLAKKNLMPPFLIHSIRTVNEKGMNH
ncbi:MAG: hypothetical protein ACI8RD_008921, partial [Bacillariaceae sp.]